MRKTLILFLIFSPVYLFLVPDVSAQLKDIKSPLLLPVKYLPIIVLFIILLAVGLAALVYFFLKKRKKYVPPPKVKSPSEIAYERIKQLVQRNLPAQGEIKEYFSELADITRQYIEDQFTIKAPEMTSQEFLEHIKHKDVFKSEYKKLLEEFLQCCDLVKFAKYGPDQKRIEESLFLVKKFVDETKRPAEHEAKQETEAVG